MTNLEMLIKSKHLGERLDSALDMQQVLLDALREDLDDYRELLENNVTLGEES